VKKRQAVPEEVYVGHCITGNVWGLDRHEPREVVAIGKKGRWWIAKVRGHRDLIALGSTSRVWIHEEAA